MTAPDDLDPTLVRILEECVERTARRLLADEKFMEQLWREHWIHFARHAKDGSAKWIGSRIITALGVGLSGLGLWLLMRGNK